jgi:WhiB family redox-sensing transcriptional regulator
MTWMAKGKCRELPPDTFFPSDGAGVEVARKICADCPVKSPCLEYAMENHIDHGVWGGTSERERRRIARRRRLAAAEAAGQTTPAIGPAAGPAVGPAMAGDEVAADRA